MKVKSADIEDGNCLTVLSFQYFLTQPKWKSETVEIKLLTGKIYKIWFNWVADIKYLKVTSKDRSSDS